jgi:CTP synthase
MGEKGFTISGTSPDGSLAELIELRDHPYFVGCQYHPEFQSKPNKPHPLFKGFIQACLEYQDRKKLPARASQEPKHRSAEKKLVLER